MIAWGGITHLTVAQSNPNPNLMTHACSANKAGLKFPLQPKANPKQSGPVQPTDNNWLNIRKIVNWWPAKYLHFVFYKLNPCI